MNLAGKAALVTGASKRLGRAIAIELARAGCDLGVHYLHSEPAAREVATLVESMGRRAALIRVDLALPDAAEQVMAGVVQSLGRLDILVNNAAVFERVSLEQADAQAWERTLWINTITPALLARAAAPLMRTGGAGRIVNLADILAEHPVRSHAPYCVSKAGLVHLTRCLAIELAPQITVNAVAPGIAVFPDDYDQALRDRLVSQVPLARPGTPEEVAALVRFLVAEGDYITGQVIIVDGGWSLAKAGPGWRLS